MAKILIIEDDTNINNMVSEYLSANGYTCTQAFSGSEGSLRFSMEEFDLILLDLMLPGMTGEELIRMFAGKVPVIVLSAKNELDRKVELLTAGANDYICKPFDLKELLVRIQVQLRSLPASKLPDVQTELHYKVWILDSETREMTAKIDFDTMPASLGGEPLTMTPTEFKILRLLIANTERVMTKTLLLEKVWDSTGNFVDEHAVAVNINRLRKKIESEEHPYIKTLYGMGYQWKGKKTEWKN
ncbi:response regulator transcription factor [Blautia pseudococcoides]|uniref:response regulator transcription factor n=1 Tax=Blautia pseudococcoides TaxID=1796616 RepID=UPI00148B18F6|nr:response regulator transcription factor [Blautia pseudococcoides]QJU16826.1 response regulator transcription factor [Blautia pseudococcoides]